MPRKGTKNTKLHWSVLTPSGEKRFFYTADEVSQFCQNEWGCPPLNRELISRVARQLEDDNYKVTCPVFYRYHQMQIKRLPNPYPIELVPGYDTVF